MKITFDFDEKVVSISEEVDLVEFIDKVKGILKTLNGWKLKATVIKSSPNMYPSFPYVLPNDEPMKITYTGTGKVFKKRNV